MRYEDSYGDEGNYLDDFAVYNPANNLAVYDGAAAYQPMDGILNALNNPRMQQSLQEAMAGRPEFAAMSTAMQPANNFAVMPPAAQPAPAAAPALDEYDDYTGRMGPDGEPERYSTMRGGDPRVKQQQELAERERRLQEPFSIENWLKSANKDVRGTTAASQITLEPGTQYRIRDYSGKNDGQIIASGSTPEEFLMMQDIARGLARQGTNADYRLEQVGGQPAQNFGQYRDPSSGEVVSVIGGDLYNKPIAGDIIKIALPAALALIPGVGAGLSAGLAAKGSVAAKMIGAGLASGIGRTAAGVLTGDPLLDSLKAGAISGLASGATAGLLDKIGVDKALSNAFSGTKGALAGETASQAAGQGISEAAKKAAEEGLITVVGSRFAPSLVSGGLSAASGSLLGDVGKSLAQPDQFQQAVDQGRLESRFGPAAEADEILALGQRVAPTIPGTDALAAATGSALTAPLSPLDLPAQAEQLAQPPGEQEIVVSGSTLPKVDLTGGLGGAAASGFDQFLSDNAGMVGDGMAETPAEDEIVVTSQPTPKVDLTGGLSALVPSVLPPTTTSPLDAATQAEQPTETPAEDEIVVTNRPTPKVDLTGGLSAIVPSALPTSTTSPLDAATQTETRIDETPAEKEIVVTSQPTSDVSLTGGLSGAAASGFDQFLSDNAGMVGDGTAQPGDDPEILAEADRIKRFEAEAAAAAAAGALSNAAPSTVEPETVVTGKKIPDQKIDSDLNLGLPIDTILPGADLIADAGQTVGKKPKDTLDKIADVAEIAGIALPIVGALAGGDKGAAGTGTYNSGRGALNPLFSAKLPTPGTAGGFTVGGLGPATGPNPLAARSAADYYRYATGPAMDLPAGVDLSRATSPYAGFGPGTLGEETFNRITTGMARGGPMGYARGSSRESFAVEGPGTGRSDDIPAVLSDGEYVIDAETVALLGDGSSRAGAKKLDELRVKVRKHKGKNLAKGKFSVNAKHPEAYMRGGRI